MKGTELIYRPRDLRYSHEVSGAVSQAARQSGEGARALRPRFVKLCCADAFEDEIGVSVRGLPSSAAFYLFIYLYFILLFIIIIFYSSDAQIILHI